MSKITFAFVLATLVLFAFFPVGRKSAPSASASKLTATLEFWAAKIQTAPNIVAKSELIVARNQALYAQFGGKEYAGEGTITGIAAMSDGVGLTIMQDDVKLTAGVALLSNVDTLIKPADRVYETLLKLKLGDKIAFKGKFAEAPGSGMVFALGSILDSTSGNFLFKFSVIQKLGT